jgi:hypothetical protein
MDWLNLHCKCVHTCMVTIACIQAYKIRQVTSAAFTRFARRVGSGEHVSAVAWQHMA